MRSGGKRAGVYAAIAIAAACASAPAFAQYRQFNVPSGDAGKSIPEFARQAQIQIVAPGDQLHGLITPPIKGPYDVFVALNLMLKGTGLVVSHSADGIVTISPPEEKKDEEREMSSSLKRSTSVLALLLSFFGGSAANAQSTAAPSGSSQGASENKIETVVVTGSRVISDAASSPTPLTIISAQELEATTPTNIPDGLNKLPIFQGSQIIGRTGGGGSNLASNVLNLRNFGAQRTLILIDGHRAPPSNADGTVDIDTLPELLISRVDVVTGGASAVYGSDAVTGVVNFILDKKFDGFKADINSSVSTYGDAAGYKVGLVGGSDLFGGRGHVEGSLEFRHRDGILVFSRPLGADIYSEVGSGTAVNPFTSVPNGRRPNSTFGGLVQSCVPVCPLATGQQFVSNGVLGPFVPGQVTGTANENSGGDGAYTPNSTGMDSNRQASVFGRFSYDLNDSTTWYVQAAASEAYDQGWHFPLQLIPGAGQTNVFYKNNPFLPATVQAALGNDGTNTPGNPATTTQPNNTFQIGEFLTGLGQTEDVGSVGDNRLLSIHTGVDGTLANGRFSWNVFYTHAENRLAENLINNLNNQKLFAQEDAVQLPNGSVACYAATQAATAAQYAGCAPINPFGPTAVTQNAFNYSTQLTYFHQTNILDNAGAGISGAVFDGWAGPITAALSAETRFNDYTVTSNVAVGNVNCTGLRLCNSALGLYAMNTLAPVHASNNVWEIAGEAEIPLLNDIPLVRNLSANVAGRYTDYSTSGSVQTWKVGLNYEIIDELRLRGTTSVDIRAPTLNDLFQPAQRSITGFTDLHTSINSTEPLITQGNSALQPEVARTYTLGAVWTPDYLPGLTVSLDYFRINLKNAIGQISATNNSIQGLCESSGGASPYCSLFQRPLPFSDRSAANYPTVIFSQALNTALVKTEGFDFETNYNFQMSDLIDNWKGEWTLRGLASYQPVNESVSFPGAPIVRTTAPKIRLTGFFSYTLDAWQLGLQDRWIGGYSQVSQAGQVWLNPHVGSFNVLDVNVARDFEVDGAKLSAYFVVQNIANTSPALLPQSANLGLTYPVTLGQDWTGRYFTIGLKADL